MNDTDISWTDYTWNPVHGCSKVSSGCLNCYAERDSHRWNHTELPWTEEYAEENVQTKPHKLEEPGGKDAGYVFVCSMSDLFHPEVPEEFIDQVFDRMIEYDQHTYQLLTKRPGRAAFYEPPHYMPNVWIGTSVEGPDVLERIDWVRQIDWAKKRFVSFEPLIENLGGFGPDLTDIDWLIVGGESGSDSRRRRMEDDWVWYLNKIAATYACSWFFKQDSARQPETIVDYSRGFVYREMPDGNPPPKPIDPEEKIYAEIKEGRSR